MTERVKELNGHLVVNNCHTSKDEAKSVENNKKQQKNEGTIPKKREDILRWDGWGYKDSGFVISSDGIYFEGDKYGMGNNDLPNIRPWAKTYLGIDLIPKENKSEFKIEDVPPPILNQEFLEALSLNGISHSTETMDRVVRAHGQALREIYILNKGMFERIPDIIVWPESHDEVVTLVELASRHNVVIIPIGGGTCVTGGLLCPEQETRTIVSLDTTQMNKILWVDEENMTARIEAGIVGQDLDRQLSDRGYCTGHNPDSIEFSTLGGWVATRASGMKKNVYGNIEDLVVHMKMVTPMGVIEKNCQVPRMSSGPDVHHFILGSEGTLGVITEVTMTIRPLSTCTKYGSLVFPDFETGIAFLRQLALERCAPASIRLMDNLQFQSGLALRPGDTSMLGTFMESAKRFYLTTIKGFSLEDISVATLLFEGQKCDVAAQMKKVYNIAKNFGGIVGGEENGRRGYMLTFVIAYIRDMGQQYNVIAESFETSVPWDRVFALSTNVKDRVKDECRKRGIFTVLVSCRVTQTYDAGAVVYFYFGYDYGNCENPVDVCEEIEALAREEVLANGGSISHHHGVGKIRKRFLTETISRPGVGMLKAVKDYLDPQNIFSNGNLML